jgi:hypothetical protein
LPRKPASSSSSSSSAITPLDSVKTKQVKKTSSAHDQENIDDDNAPLLQVSSLPNSELQNLTDIQKIRDYLHLLNDEETRVDLDLDGILSSQHFIEEQLATLQGIEYVIEILFDNNTV